MTLTTIAVLLLVVACIAAVQARTARGTPRHRLEDLCQKRGRPGLDDEIAAGSEPVAFIAATIVAVMATLATLVAGQTPDLRGPPGELHAPGMLVWTALVWTLLVAPDASVLTTVRAAPSPTVPGNAASNMQFDTSV